MNAVGVRDLKNRLSHHLKRVRAGARLTVTERGKPIATLAPVEVKDDLEWIRRMVARGEATWSGGKPTGSKNPPRNRGKLGSDIVIEDRR
ncbi:MAG TPA: type II toxin-antitoxin system prevent-host-death family antitoxin [Vicinamibacterales bacterium]|nr:type II toxin-antitoxin system prevent-host-death family antitoxin [Vicinamibacterales bacterium]